MSVTVTPELLDHLAGLARLTLTPEEKERFAKNLGDILGYFDELNALDTTGVEPLVGGAFITNSFRDDAEREGTNRGGGVESFPEEQDGYLKVPAVFG